MAVPSRCPECQATFNVSEKALGKTASCPKCGNKFVLTAATEPEDNGGFEVIEDAPPPKKKSPSLSDALEVKSRRSARDDDEEADEPRRRSRRRDEQVDDEDRDDEAVRRERSRRRRARMADEDERPQKSKTGLYVIVGVVTFTILICTGCGGYAVWSVNKTVKQVQDANESFLKDQQAKQIKPGADGWSDVSDPKGKYRVLLPGPASPMELFGQTPKEVNDPYAGHDVSNLDNPLSASIRSFQGKALPATQQAYYTHLKDLDFEFEGPSYKVESQVMGKAGAFPALIVRSKPRTMDDDEYRITVLVVTTERSYVLVMSQEDKYPSDADLNKMLNSFLTR
ncbi:MAG: hypothetical protein ACRC8S_12570 [Fimbriiglobus sp.]